MNITKKQLSKSQLELTVEVTPAELQPFLLKTAEEISQEKKIAGFRPGKAPYGMIKKEVGEMAIYQQALDKILSKTLFAALNQECKDLEITGQPQINVEKLAPGNSLTYKAVITLVPEIKIGNWQKIKIEKKETAVAPEEVDKILNNLKNYQAKESLKLGQIEKGDKINIKFDVYLDNVPIENGSHPEYPLVIGEEKFIPGFEDQLIGLSKGEKKEFELRFPENYHTKNLANKLAKFKVEIKETYKRELPELNDELAKNLGYKNLTEVKNGIEANLKSEAEQKEKQRQEITLLEELIKVTTFEDIPKNLIQDEAHRLVHEMAASLENQGLKFTDYLTHLKKTEEDLMKEMLPQAEKRIKTALITRQLAKDHQLQATPAEIDQELEKMKNIYRENPEALTNLANPGYRQYLSNVLTNRKMIEFLREKLIS